MDTQIPLLLTRLLYESEDPQGTLAEIKRVVAILDKALDVAGAIETGSHDRKQH